MRAKWRKKRVRRLKRKRRKTRARRYAVSHIDWHCCVCTDLYELQQVNTSQFLDLRSYLSFSLVDKILPAPPTVNTPNQANPIVQRNVMVKVRGSGQKAVGIGWQERVKYYRAILWRFLHEKAVDSIDVSMSKSISWSSALWSLQVASINDLVLCYFISPLHAVYPVDSLGWVPKQFMTVPPTPRYAIEYSRTGDRAVYSSKPNFTSVNFAIQTIKEMHLIS